ncbi:ribonuclease Oy-like isoform X1 [Haliotis rubra]|uniref:ribonuclease Oy-like isoform X1 n=2 Tax=Haliotis rubra TaxID=36100 RepID=UPI001EE62D21|nr:ribonuclease Oy-like isoform X1 [Haliotis rubra]
MGSQQIELNKMPVRGVVIVLFLALMNTAISGDKNWTYFVFAQHWPPSLCNDASQMNHTCKGLPKPVKTWTVHGLWPTNIDEPRVKNCNGSWHFNCTKIKPLQKQLETSWPNLFEDTNFTWLWKHEWTAHGTCAASLEATNNEFRYFQKALSLNSVTAFNPQTALENFGITPSCTRAYSVNAIQKALMEYFRLDTPLKIICARQRVTGRTMLLEIHMALSKTFNVTRMPSNSTSCCTPADQIYIFPISDMHCFQ